MAEATQRTNEIVKVSLRGIAVNLALVAFKAAVGLAANSIAVILDAVNNLSDALSSVITIVGTKLAGRAADRQHPFGHGRIEYISAFAVAVMVLLAGVTSLKESVGKILHPEETGYTAVSLVILAAGVGAKIFLGTYFSKKGKALNSASLEASGTDALFDAIISFATFLAAVVAMTLGWKLEGILGAVISLFILNAGIEIMYDTVQTIIGVRADSTLTKNIIQSLNEYPEVNGAFDLILHSYGPDTYFGSVHVELDDEMTVRELDMLTRRIVPQIFSEYGVLLTVGVYATNTYSEEAKAIRKAVHEEIAKHPEIIQMHGFYADTEDGQCDFDIIFDFRAEDPGRTVEEIRKALTEQFPLYHFSIVIDRDFSTSDEE